MDAIGIIYLGTALAAVAAAITGFFALFGKGPRGSVLVVAASIFTWGVLFPILGRDPDDGSITRELDLLSTVLCWIGFFGVVLGLWEYVGRCLKGEESRGGVVTSTVEWVLQIPLIWGGMTALAFYALLNNGWIHSPLLKQYMAGHRVEYVIGAIFFVGLAAIIMRFLHLAGQFASLGRVSLGPVPIGGHPISASVELLAILSDLPATLQQSYLAKRLRDALEFVSRKGSADTLDDQLRHLEEVEQEKIHSSYGMIRLIIWAIPILGLLGTVIGITMSIGNLNPQTLEESVSTVTKGLGIAFDHTAEALTLTMVLMFLKAWVERVEHRLFATVDERAAEELIGRFEYTGAADDPNVAAIRRMSDQVICAVEALASRQAEVWKSSIEVTNERWAESTVLTGEVIGQSLKSSLRDAMEQHALRLNEGVNQHADKLTHNSNHVTNRLREGLEKLAELLVESLHRHGEVLTESEKELAEENRRHLSQVENALSDSMVVAADRQEQLIRRSEDLLKEMQVALVDAAEATVRQQEQLVKQGDVLLRVVDATGQVKALEETLNENLASLANGQQFEDMMINLTAAIQMLCARSGHAPTKFAPGIDSASSKPTSNAA